MPRYSKKFRQKVEKCYKNWHRLIREIKNGMVRCVLVAPIETTSKWLYINGRRVSMLEMIRAQAIYLAREPKDLSSMAFNDWETPSGIADIRSALIGTMDFLNSLLGDNFDADGADLEVLNFIYGSEGRPQSRAKVLLPAVSKKEMVKQVCTGPRGMCGG